MLSAELPSEELLAVPPNERTDEQVHQLLSLRSLDAFANLPSAELLALARCWKYETHEAGSVICAINDEHPCFMVVVSGSLMLEETKLCHNLGETRSSSVASPEEASSLGLSTRLLTVRAKTFATRPVHSSCRSLAQLHDARRASAQLQDAYG